MLEGKRIVLGVSGGIAAYKAIDVCRRLVDAGAHVIPVLTEGALHFVGRTTFDALGSERAWTSLWDEQHPIPHTHLGQTADLVLVRSGHRPRARALRRAASATICCSTPCLPPVPRCSSARRCTPRCGSTPPSRTTCVCSARRGVHVVEPDVGRLAGGDVGAGRLADARGDRRGRHRDPPRWSPPGRPHRHSRDRHRGRHPRADRPGALHRQPVLGQAGPRRRRGGRRPRRQGHPRHHRRAPGVGRHRCRPRRHRRRDGARRAAAAPTTPTSW